MARWRSAREFVTGEGDLVRKAIQIIETQQAERAAQIEELVRPTLTKRRDEDDPYKPGFNESQSPFPGAGGSAAPTSDSDELADERDRARRRRLFPKNTGPMIDGVRQPASKPKRAKIL